MNIISADIHGLGKKKKSIMPNLSDSKLLG